MRLTTLLLATVIAAPVAVRAQAAGTAHDSATRAVRREMREEKREKAGKAERHPEIRAAIRSLERAKGELEHASHDFGGHRADAVKAVDEALKQLRLALTYDKK
jgi:hypothetical protein